MPRSKNQPLYDQLGITRNYTKRRYQKKEEYTSVDDNKRLQEDCTFMMDIMELPTSAFGYHFLLVCTDIATHEFDIEPLKTKHADTVLKAFKKMIDRPYLNLPKYYMITDSGSEFKGVFKKYLYDESIYHKQTPPHIDTLNLLMLIT